MKTLAALLLPFTALGRATMRMNRAQRRDRQLNELKAKGREHDALATAAETCEEHRPTFILKEEPHANEG